LQLINIPISISISKAIIRQIKIPKERKWF